MTPPTNVATVIGNVAPALTHQHMQLTSPRPAPRCIGSAHATPPGLSEKSGLTPPPFKPPKSPTPHGRRYFRAVSPTPQRASSPLLPSPDTPRCPDLFSITVTRDRTPETLAVPVPAMGGGGGPCRGESTTLLVSTSQLPQDLHDRCSQAPAPSPSSPSTARAGEVLLAGVTTTHSSTDTQEYTRPPDLTRPPDTASPGVRVSSASDHSSATPPPLRPHASHPHTLGTPHQAGGCGDDTFLQPQLLLSTGAGVTPDTTAPASLPSPCGQAGPTPTPTTGPARTTLRSVSSTSDTGSTHSSSDVILTFRANNPPALRTGGAPAVVGSAEGQQGEGGGGGGGGDSALEEVGEEVGLEEERGLLLPASCRPHSAPHGNTPRLVSSSSLSSLTQGHFRATKADYFRSDGRWRVLLHVFDRWTRSKPSSCRSNLDLHSRAQRHYFHVSRLEYPDEVSPSSLREKRHVVVSLLQDYRHGAVTANSLLVPIGFCVYKCKGGEREDKRHISRLPLIEEVLGEPEMREVTARLDLDPGYYLAVAFCRSQGHTGEYLLRVLTDDCPRSKAGCRVS